MDFYSMAVTGFLIMAVITAAYFVSIWSVGGFTAYWKLRSGGEEPPHGMKSLISVGIWLLAIFFTLDNLGFKVSALLAGLGIGGVAVALASQNILGDIFNYFVIILDRPFVRGDFVTVAEGQMGVIERVGLKTTRIRSISGEELIIANADMMNSRLRNYKTLTERRVPFSIGLTYGSPQEKLAEAPLVIKEIIEGMESTRFDRAHFARLGDSALEFDIVYYVTSSDYALYMDIQQKINLEIKSRFEAMGLSFAFPTQSIHLAGDKERP